MNNNIKISRADIPFKIKADDMVTKTNLGRYSKIVHMHNSDNDSNSSPMPVIIKKSKTEYLDTRTGEIKSYSLDRPTDIKDIRKKLNRYNDIVLCNFPGSRSELFVTLTCSDNVQDIQTIRRYYDNFRAKMKRRDKYKTLEYIALFEQNAKDRWHIHLFMKYPDNKVLTIPYIELKAIWGHGNVYIIQNLNTMQNLNHSADKKQERLERFTKFPKGKRMYYCSKGIKTPTKEKLQFQECPEYYSSDYTQISRKTYIMQNAETDKVVNAVTTAMFKNINPTADKQVPVENQDANPMQETSTNDSITEYSPTITPTAPNEREIKIRQMIERQNQPGNRIYWEFI